MYNNPYNFYPYMNGMNGFNTASTIGARSFAPAGAISGMRNTFRPGLFQSIRNIKWGTVLTNTQKTLNVINQAIPVYYQIKPIATNLRSFGKIMKAFNTPDTPTQNNNIQDTQIAEEEKKDQKGLPTFFID